MCSQNWEQHVTVERGIVVVCRIVQSVLVRKFHPQSVSSLQGQDGDVSGGTLVSRHALARAPGAVIRRQEARRVSHQVEQRALTIIAYPVEADHVRAVFRRREHAGSDVIVTAQVR